MRLLIIFLVSFPLFLTAQQNLEILIAEAGSTGVVNQITYSQDGKSVAFNRDGIILFCDVRTGKVVRNLRSDFRRIKRMVLSRDWKFLAVVGDYEESDWGAKVQLWNLIDGTTRVAALHDNKEVKALAFSPDSKYLATGGTNNDIYVFSIDETLETEQLMIFDKKKDGHRRNLQDLIYTPDGNTLISSANDNTIKFWNIGSASLEKTIEVDEGDIFTMSIDPGGRYLAAGGRDNKIRLWDLETEAMTVLPGHDKDIIEVIISQDGKMIVSSARDRKIKFWNLEGKLIHELDLMEVIQLGGTILNSVDPKMLLNFTTIGLSPNSKYLAFASFSRALGGYLSLDATGTNAAVSVYDISRKKVIRQLPELASSPIRQMVFSADGKRLCILSEDRFVQILNLEQVRQEVAFQIPDTTIQYVILSPEFDYILFKYDVTEESLADQAGNYIYRHRYELCRLPEGPREEGSFSFADREVLLEIPGYFHGCNRCNRFWSAPVTFSADGRFLAASSRKDDQHTVKVWELARDQAPKLAGEAILEYTKEPENVYDPVFPVHFSESGQYLSVATYGLVYIFETGHWEEPAGVFNFSQSDYEIYQARFLNGDQSMFLSYREIGPENSASGEVRALLNISYTNPNQVKEKKTKAGRFLAKMLDQNLEAYDNAYPVIHGGLFGETPVDEGNGQLFEQGSLDLMSRKTLSSALASDLSYVALSKNDELVFRTIFGDRFSADQSSGTKPAWQLPRGSMYLPSYITAMATAPDPRYLAAGSQNGSIVLLDLASGREILTIALARENYIFITPEHYYATSRDGGDLVVCRIGDEYYPFDVMDVKYNRPDKVWETLTREDIAMIPKTEEMTRKFEAYYHAYLKRIEKMGLQESDLESDPQYLPRVEILNVDQLPIETSDGQLSLNLKISDPERELTTLHISVNAVPLFGKDGLDLSAEGKRTIERSLDIPLSYGSNQIQVEAVNSAGIRSLRETVPNILRQGNPPPPDLYLIAIGVSTYQDEQMNLQFAQKDASEINHLFSGRQGSYRTIHDYELVNEAATRDNILALADVLKKSRIDDQVIIYFAGHGMYDTNYDYYLGTYDIDFNNPSVNGLSYDQLLGLLDGIPARNKLLLLDACHSGEIDPENVKRVETVLEQAEGITFRSFASAGLKEKQVGLENSFELMKTLFADLRAGTGAAVITAAGGVEYALEGGDTQNGIFTYALLNGLRKKEADLDRNGAITVSELQRYLNLEVPRLTHNQQRPTSRTRRFGNNWRVW